MKQTSSLRDHAVRTVQFGDVSVTELCVPRQAAAGGSAHASDRAPLRELLFVVSGELYLRHRGLPIRLHALQWSLCDTGQILLSAAENTRALVMTIPGAGQVQTVIHSAATGVDSVLFACVRSALKAANELSSQARAELGNSLTELATLALREKSAQEHRITSRKIMRERVKSFVRRNLRNSGLSIDDIARTFHCTKRYLHKVFSEEECSLNQYIWDLRLAGCYRDLANPDLLDRSITEIAFGWGFRSTPHFSRVFRRRFGVSPSAYRAANSPRCPQAQPVESHPVESHPRLLAQGLRAERQTQAL